MILRGYNL